MASLSILPPTAPQDPSLHPAQSAVLPQRCGVGRQCNGDECHLRQERGLAGAPPLAPTGRQDRPGGPAHTITRGTVEAIKY